MFDTASKRYSMLRFGRPFVPLVLAPTGSIEEGERHVSVARYAGTLAAAVSLELSAVVYPGRNLEGVVYAGRNLTGRVV